MLRDSESAAAPLIDRAHPRTVFAELVAGALCETRVRPSPMAVSYLIELLDSQVGRVSPEAAESDGDASLAEALLTATLHRGSDRVTRLRKLGDRALFVAGYFGDSLSRSVVDLDYYGDVGRAAYASLAETLGCEVREQTWPSLYNELADRFDQFIDVLTAVGDRSRPRQNEDLLRVFERYLRTGSERDRARLLRLGHAPPDRDTLRFWQ
ncbi:MAG: hypothetical protein ACE5FL_16015 [Myxococcota bacterium]